MPLISFRERGAGKNLKRKVMRSLRFSKMVVSSMTDDISDDIAPRIFQLVILQLDSLVFILHTQGELFWGQVVKVHRPMQIYFHTVN